jgi:pyridoxamine 5'-phosphate oxidase
VSPEQIELLDAAHAAFAAALNDRHHAFRTAMLGNVDHAGQPQVRAVVVRDVDSSARTLKFHTDVRSPKVAQLKRDPRAAVTAYDAVAQLQVRLSGSVDIHHDDALTHARWQSMQPMSQACYAEPLGSSQPIATPHIASAVPLDGSAARAQMAVIVLRYHQIEVLKLSRFGHRRLRVDYSSGVADATWLTP